jgi:hypothetical protein
MSTAPATTETAADAGEVAAALRDAPFVRVVAAADGDAVAASGVLARALRTVGVPFQVRVDPLSTPTADDDETLLTVGTAGGDHALGVDAPASVAAFETARALGADSDPTLALAGVAAAGHPLGTAGSAPILDAAGSVERRPGLCVPTADDADGLAHSTLARTPASGDPETASETVASLAPDGEDEEARRRLASWLVVEASGPTPRAAEAVERAVHPHAAPDASFATVEGFGDVLDAVARERPGTGVALALRDDEATRAAALDAWRAHGEWVHDALSTATTGRYEGLLVARVDGGEPGRLATAARLCRDFRSPEPAVLVVGDGAAAASAADATVGEAMAAATSAVDGAGESAGRRRRAVARFDGDVEVTRFITAFREAL